MDQGLQALRSAGSPESNDALEALAGRYFRDTPNQELRGWAKRREVLVRFSRRPTLSMEALYHLLKGRSVFAERWPGYAYAVLWKFDGPGYDNGQLPLVEVKQPLPLSTVLAKCRIEEAKIPVIRDRMLTHLEGGDISVAIFRAKGEDILLAIFTDSSNGRISVEIRETLVAAGRREEANRFIDKSIDLATLVKALVRQPDIVKAAERVEARANQQNQSNVSQETAQGRGRKR